VPAKTVLDKELLFDRPGLLFLEPALAEAIGQRAILVRQRVNLCIARMRKPVL
jgi:hypothetical protein